MFQNYKFNFPTENSEQLLSVFVSGSVVMTVILNTTFVLWLTAQSVHCTLLQPGCTKIFNGLDLIQFSVANGTAGDQLHLPFSSAVDGIGPRTRGYGYEVNIGTCHMLQMQRRIFDL